MKKYLNWFVMFLKVPLFRLLLGVLCMIGTIYSLSLLVRARGFFEESVFLLLTMLLFFGSFLLIVQLILYWTNSSHLDNAYSNLDYWVRNNDIGNATNLVRSLSENESIQVYFNKKLKLIRSTYKENNKKFVVTSKHEFLVDSIPELVSVIDEATVDSLIFLKTYIDFEPKNKTIQEKLLNGVLSIACVGGFLGSVKYGIDFLSVKETYNLGGWILLLLFIIGIFIMIVVCIINIKNTRERNARNFLLLVFKAIEHKKSSEEASKAILKQLTSKAK